MAVIVPPRATAWHAACGVVRTPLVTDSSDAEVAPTAHRDAHAARQVLALDGVRALFELLAAEGHTVIGPTRRDGAIVLDELSSPDELPVGWGDVQRPGSYRLVERGDEALFGYVVGPHSYRRFFQVPREQLVQLRRKGRGFEVEPAPTGGRKLALLGVRACDIEALGIQDQVLLRGPYPDEHYAARRGDALVIAVACHSPAATCFCTSMGGGPRPVGGFDLSLSEVFEGGHRFVVEAGSEAGARLLSKLATSALTPADVVAADASHAAAVNRITRRLDTTDIKRLLYDAAEHPRFDDVAKRCLACTSCTLVCPTCFCTRVDDVTSLDGETAERVRSWDSCFSLDYAYMHGGPARSSVGARYRHFITHKLASWKDQFGSSGCVGCGRCVTWCPAGIDITEEVAAIRAEPTPPRSKRI